MTSNVGASQIIEPTTLGFDVTEGDPEKRLSKNER